MKWLKQNIKSGLADTPVPLQYTTRSHPPAHIGSDAGAAYKNCEDTEQSAHLPPRAKEKHRTNPATEATVQLGIEGW